jgi:peptidoglycan/LPS O-acetylase OafA/YrhL
MRDRPKHDVIRPLTGIRGLTIAWVVANHASFAIKCLAPGLMPLVLLSERLGFRMDFLFQLSGFVLTYVYVRRHEHFDLKVYREFLWRRLCRIYPSYLAALLFLVAAVGLCWLLEFPINYDHFQLRYLPFRLALLHAWPFFSWTRTSWNYPTWFLSALWFAYLFAFPCIWKMFPRFRASRFGLPWVFAPLLVYVLADTFTGLGQFREVFRAFCEVISGAALCALYLERKSFMAAMQRHLDKIVFLVVISFVPVLLDSSTMSGQIVTSLAILACPAFLAGLTAERSRFARLLATRQFQWVGTISYSLFVSHGVVLALLKHLLPPERFAGSPLFLRYAVLAFYVFAVLSFAIVLYKLVEVPCAEALKQRFTRRRSLLGKGIPTPQQPTYPVAETSFVLREEDL